MAKDFVEMTSLRKLILPMCLILTLSATVVLGVAIWAKVGRAERVASDEQNAVTTQYRQVPMYVDQRPSVLFVGDDFTAGAPGEYTYPYIVCDSFGMNCNIDAQGGTGFINDGRDLSAKNARLIDRLAKDRQVYDADTIIIDAGRRDLQSGVEAYGQAFDGYLRAVREFWPRAQIIIIVPSFLTTDIYPEYAELVSVISQKAEIYGAVWIDPVAEGWYNEVDLAAVKRPDDIDPNDAGHLLIGKKLAESLQQHGFLERKAPVS